MQRAAIWWSRGFFAFGTAAFPLYLLGNEPVRIILSLVIMNSMLPAIWIAWKHHKFPNGFIVILSLIGTAYVASAIVGSLVDEDRALLFTTPIDVVANSLIIAAMAFVVARRRGKFSSGDILDGVIIGFGGWLVAWVTLVQPFIVLEQQPPLGLVLNALYLPMAAPLLALSAALVFSGSGRRASTWLLVGGTIMNILGDAIYALFEVGHSGVWAETTSSALYLLAFSWSGAAFIHPTAPDLIGHSENHQRLQLPGRLAVTGLSLTIPILLVSVIPATSDADRIVRAITALVILALVSFRLAGATRSHLQAQERLIESARTDALTGLPNRIALLEAAQVSIDSTWRNRTRPSIYLIDIDRFKNTNDSLGHAAGDEAIQLIAARLTAVGDQLGVTVGRPSSDEFIVLDTGTSTTGEALARAEALHDVFKTPISLQAGVMFLTASIGVATMATDRDVDPADLFRQADIAMYRAKDAGRNCLALYHDSMQQRLTKRIAIETALHSALENREMRLYHQPIVDTTSGRVAGFEALIRWQRSDGTMMSPAEFIPIAEETGIITGLGSWALLEALTQLGNWIHEGVVSDSTTMSVNVSARQLADPAFCDIVDEALTRSGLQPHLLWLEVTETMMIDNPDLARETLQRIRATGVRVALDDFGTGYSSLSLLQQFPIQRIKIDRAFVSGIAENSNDRSLVRTIIAMGGSLGLDIVGEGVETVEQLRLLRDLGCDKAQGYLISHPVPAEAMRSTIAALESLAQWEAFADALDEPSSSSTH